MTIKLTDAAKYYKELPHQREAFIYLQSAMEPGIMSRFEHLYRTPKAPPIPKENEGGERAMVALILTRIKKLGIELDKPPQSADPEDYCVNIIGLEGLNPDFTLNDDKPNHFNDLFILLGINKDGKFRYLQKSVGTTEPSSHYTYNRINSKGAARIEIDVKHEKIWQFGYHGRGNGRHLALLQIGNAVCVRRDHNQDFARTGDKLDCGYHGINFHCGYDNPTTNIGRASAGCQVIRSRKEHAASMEHLKRDYYYTRNNKHRFSYICLDASKVFSNGTVTPRRERDSDVSDDLWDIVMKMLVHHECGGVVSRYLNAYADPAHGWRVPTIGIGTITYPNGAKVRKGDTITEEQAYIFARDFIEKRLIPNLSKIPSWGIMSTNQKASLISFGYNLGAFYGANGFNTISRALREQRWKDVPNAILLYDKAGGRALPGLTKRRKDEAELFKK